MVRAAAAAAIVASSLLTGCASIVDGTSQVVTVEARNQGQLVKGASCKLQNAKGTFYVTAPGTVTIHRSRDDLVVQCDKENIKPGLAKIKSSVKGMTYGNILLGGIVGAIVDQSSGAAFDYPAMVTVLMGENGAPIAPFSPPGVPAAPVAPTVQGSPGRNGERQLTGKEMQQHFSSLGTVTGHSPSGAKMLYDVGQGGRLEVKNLDKGGGTMGAYEFKEAENQICLTIYGGSGWRIMQDCYRLYQVNAGTFAMRSATDKYFFTYDINGGGGSYAEQPVAAPSATYANATPATSAPPNDTPAPPVPPASAAPLPVIAVAAPAGLPAEQIGQYSYQSEHLARAQSCSAAPHAILNARGPGFESYTVSCDNGDSLAMRCDFGQCRILR
ncbi:hypothetical protein CFter6_4496 [Collimonas fungivorans]|uniref:Lipoprotein n=1 Tax=Collimonas fungivorans TaxID=158899 RepID=A0A127PH67_9BURK|nr:hypothetical protein CFter6_4496 [Collimonas fungivorans]